MARAYRFDFETLPMMISHKHQFVFMSTPKTGTHSLYELLPRYGGARFGGYHERHVPSDAKTYFRFTTCREPLDRTVATWHSLLHHSEHRPLFLRLCRGDTFPDFVRWLIRQPNDRVINGRGFACISPQTIRIPHQQMNAVLRMEQLTEDFNQLPFVDKLVTIPHELMRPHPTCQELLPESLYSSLIHWLSPDFNSLPYDRPGT